MTRKYRYRQGQRSGSTKQGLLDFNKHLAKVGAVISIKGYQYDDGAKVKQIAVLVTGTLGTMRLNGFSWGYDGEGCRGTRALFAKLNVPESEIERVMKIEWAGWKGKPREFWKIVL